MNEGQRTRCLQCGALAAPGDEWCGQCYARLTRTSEPSPATAIRSPTPPPATPGAAGTPIVPAPPMPAAPEGSGEVPREDRRSGVERRTDDVRRAPVDRRAGEDRRSPEGRPTPASLLSALWEMPTVPEPTRLVSPTPAPGPPGTAPADSPTFLDGEPLRPGPTWPCAVCQTPNPLDRDTCVTCGAPFARLFDEPGARTDVRPSTALRFSLLFPGLGHAVAGRKAEGLARAILFAWCAATAAILLLAVHPAGGLGILAPMAMVFAAGTAVWYGATAYDAYRLAGGEPQVVTSKVMLYAVAAMMMLSIGSVFLMVSRAAHVGH